MEKPTREEVTAAKRAIAEEDRARWARKETPERQKSIDDSARRSSLPSEDPEHIHSMMCDGQDGMNSYCERLRRKLFGEKT